MIIWLSSGPTACPKPIPEPRFLPQNRRSIPHRLHGETMSTGVSHSGERPAWSAQQHFQESASTVKTRPLFGSRVRPERSSGPEFLSLLVPSLPQPVPPQSELPCVG